MHYVTASCGTGKTHLALALGLSACQHGHRVRFTTAAAMVHELLEARDEKRLLRYQKQMASYERLIGALLDRLTHHVHILEMNGESYRLKQSKRKRSPQPNS